MSKAQNEEAAQDARAASVWCVYGLPAIAAAAPSPTTRSAAVAIATAAEAATTAAARSAAATLTAPAASAARPAAIARLINLDATSLQIRLVQRLNRLRGAVLIRHLNESESP